VIWGDEGEVRSFQDRWSGGIDHYIGWLKERIEQMYRILKPTGSIFLHCDWHADAYIRVEILNRIFGIENFNSHIIWERAFGTGSSKGGAKKVPVNVDSIFYYNKNKNDYTFNLQTRPINEGALKRYDKNPRYKKYLDETKGTPIDTLWNDIDFIGTKSSERIGYPTQKPEALLQRIIEMASNEGDIVLDPFVGGGTTIAVADRLKRQWIGIDQSVQAVKD
jgi:site-specific DNA-methyltransferase (adenine-specific)